MGIRHFSYDIIAYDRLKFSYI